MHSYVASAKYTIWEVQWYEQKVHYDRGQPKHLSVGESLNNMPTLGKTTQQSQNEADLCVRTWPKGTEIAGEKFWKNKQGILNNNYLWIGDDTGIMRGWLQFLNFMYFSKCLNFLSIYYIWNFKNG